MKKYILKRLFWMVVALIAMISILFILIQFIPNGLINSKLPAETQEAIKRAYGLDKPIIEQYFIFIKNMLTFNFGVSMKIATGTPVTTLIAPKFAVSAKIGMYALLFGTTVGLTFGSFAALYRNKWQDNTLSTLAIIGIALPSFVFASLLQFIFAIKLGWFPSSFDSERFISFILPAFALSVYVIAALTRYMRSELIEVNNSDYILLAKAKGVKQRDIVIKHSIRNALIPVITILGPLTLGIMTGALVVEKIFSIPGIGGILVDSVFAGDHTVTTAVAYILGFFYMVVILLVDISYGLIDPRIRVGGKSNGH